jgi:uncharacterized membrane protein HdeD (DUF308 family)
LASFFLPGITLVTLVLLFGAYALVDGTFNVIAFIRVASHRWALLIEGVTGLIAGILTIRVPAITALVLLCLSHSGRSLQASLRLSRAFVSKSDH